MSHESSYFPGFLDLSIGHIRRSRTDLNIRYRRLVLGMHQVDVRSPSDARLHGSESWQPMANVQGNSVLIHFQAEDVLLELFLGLQTGPNPLSFVISPSKYREK